MQAPWKPAVWGACSQAALGWACRPRNRDQGTTAAKLYFSPYACSLSPHTALREAGLPFTLVLASPKIKTLADRSDFLTIHSKGEVPVLDLDNGRRPPPDRRPDHGAVHRRPGARQTPGARYLHAGAMARWHVGTLARWHVGTLYAIG